MVGARTDRGVSTLSNWELTEFCNERGIDGGYVPTSAQSGEGVDDLMQKITALIPWEQFSSTITTATFKTIKDKVLALKEAPELEHIVVSYLDLQQLLGGDSKKKDIEASVGHLSNHGYVHKLRRANGDEIVLLKPDLLVNVASSMILEARRHERGLGLLDESKLLSGGYGFRELDGLPDDDREALLDAAAGLFLDRHLAFRETLEDRSVLVAPALINQKRPQKEARGLIEGHAYRISGSVENVYASLVVQLGYTDEFERDQHRWQKHAQFGVDAEQICGFEQTREDSGEIEIALYYGANTPDEKCSRFQTTFERFLSKQTVEVERIPTVACGKCNERQPRATVLQKIDSNAEKFFCNNCGNGINTPAVSKIGEAPPAEAKIADAQVAVADRRTAFEEALVWIKALRRDQGKSEERPSCFISYAWGVAEHEKWVVTLARDLRKADVAVILDRWDSPPGTAIQRFIKKITSADYVVAVGTPAYLTKYESEDRDAVVNAEVVLIESRLRKASRRETIRPVLLEGTQETSYPPMFDGIVACEFLEKEKYFSELFLLVMSIHKIPFDHPRVEEFIEKMGPRDHQLSPPRA